MISSLDAISPTMYTVARSQNMIGWCEFMEGRVSKNIVAIQQLHCLAAPCRMNGDDWIKHFILFLLQLSYSQ